MDEYGSYSNGVHRVILYKNACAFLTEYREYLQDAYDDPNGISPSKYAGDISDILPSRSPRLVTGPYRLPLKLSVQKLTNLSNVRVQSKINLWN